MINLTLQDLAAWSIVAAAGVYLAGAARRALSHRAAGVCGGCSGCSRSANSAAGDSSKGGAEGMISVETLIANSRRGRD